MPEQKSPRGPRRVLLATAAAVVLGAGGAGVAHASTNDAGPVETGYVVVGTSEDASQDVAGSPGAYPGTSAGTDRECEERGGGGQGTSPSTPAPSTTTTDVEGQL